MVTFHPRPVCEICGCNDVRIVHTSPFDASPVWNFIDAYYEQRVPQKCLRDASFQVAWCPRCTFLWQVNILDGDGMCALYEEWISPEHSLAKKTEADGRLYLRYAAEAELVSRLHRSPRSSLHVIDFGMGWGYWCLMARAFGYQVTGVELSEARKRYARDRGITTVDSIHDAEPAEFINADQVLEHVPDPKQTMVDLASRLRPGGVLRVSVPDGRRMRKRLLRPGWRPAKDALHPLEHINCFNNRSLRRLGLACGLEVLPPQPLRLPAVGAVSVLRNLIVPRFRRYFSTTLYFRKSGENALT